MSKAGSYPSGEKLSAFKYQPTMKATGTDKHASLLQHDIDYRVSGVGPRFSIGQTTQ